MVADFNGDGKLDLICGDGTVQLGNGDGTFKSGAPWNGFGANLLGSADFNGDGRPDLLVGFTNNDPTSLYVLLGNGDGTFRAPAKTNIGTSLNSLVVADINGDGKPDVVGTSGALGLMVLLGKGDGTFMTGSTYSLSSLGYLVSGDFNGDGKQDVALANSAGQINVFLGNGDGTFKTPVITSTGPSPSSPFGIVAADLNGDGKLDLVISSNKTYVLLGKGDGTFQAPSAAVNAAGGILVLDLNGDGKQDLVVGTDFVQVFLGNGDGTFSFKVAYLAPFDQGMAAGDFNGDGKQDLITGNEVFLGNGDGTFKDSFALHGLAVSAGAEGDFNGDGVPDMAILTYSLPASNSGSISILIGDGKGNFSVAHTYALPEPVPSCSIGCIGTADVNGDGKLDLVVPGNDPVTHNLSLQVLLGNGDGTFVPVKSSAQALYTEGVQMALADLNGDGKADVVVLTGGTGSDVAVLLNNGDGTFASPTSYFAGMQVGSFVVADLNNDGKLDIATGSAAGLGVLLGKGDGTFEPATFSSNSGTGGVLVEAAADLNRDGNVDLISDRGVLLGNGDGTFDLLPSAPLLRTSLVVDVNGDGKADLVGDFEVADPCCIGTYLDAIGVQLGNGDGTFGNEISLLTALNIDSLGVVGKALVNGRPDLFVSFVNTYTSEGGLVILQNTAGPLAPDFLVSVTALSPKIVVPGNSATSAVTLTAISGFNANVVLSCTDLPSGTTCSFSPASVNGSGASTLTIATSAATPVGTYPVEIVGTGPTLTHNVTLTLTLATSAGATTTGVAPNSLVFGIQPMGTTSSPQMAQLTNTGSAQLAIASVALTGPNPNDFAISNNACGLSVAAGSGCAISVTFTPTGMGNRSASLTISDNATGSPHIVALSGTGPDFLLAVTSSASANVTPGQTATYLIAIAPSGGFNQTVTIGCTGAPSMSSCAVSPSAVTLNGNSSASVTVTIATTAPKMGFLPSRPELPWKTDHRPLVFLIIALFAMISVVGVASLMIEKRMSWVRALSIMALAAGSILLASCGGGSGGSSSGSPGTPAGTYTISISAAAGSGSATATRTTTLTLVVQ